MRIKQRLLALSDIAADRQLSSDNLYTMEVIGERLHDVAEDMVLKHKYDKEIKKNGRLVINHLHEMYDTPIDYLKVVLLTRAYELLPSDYQPRTVTRRTSASALKRAVYSTEQWKKMERERREREKVQRKCLGCNKRFTAQSVIASADTNADTDVTKVEEGDSASTTHAHDVQLAELSEVEALQTVDSVGSMHLDTSSSAESEGSVQVVGHTEILGACNNSQIQKSDTQTQLTVPEVAITYTHNQRSNTTHAHTHTSSARRSPRKRSTTPRVRLGVISGDELDSEEERSHSDSSTGVDTYHHNNRRRPLGESVSGRTALQV